MKRNNEKKKKKNRSERDWILNGSINDVGLWVVDKCSILVYNNNTKQWFEIRLSIDIEFNITFLRFWLSLIFHFNLIPYHSTLFAKLHTATDLFRCCQQIKRTNEKKNTYELIHSIYNAYKEKHEHWACLPACLSVR